jgi:hypothetical protein
MPLVSELHGRWLEITAYSSDVLIVPASNLSDSYPLPPVIGYNNRPFCAFTTDISAEQDESTRMYV